MAVRRDIRIMILGRLTAVLLVLCTGLYVHGQSRAAGNPPDLTGTWNSGTATPLERPPQFKDKEFFTREEATAWEHQTAARNADPPPGPSQNVGTYSSQVWREVGSKVVKTLRTSIVFDPPDGRIPALTPAAAAEKRRRQELLNNPRDVKDLGQQDRCLVFPTAVPPMTPFAYNSNYQIIQTGETLMIQAEMAHETRIIPLDGRPHLPSNVRLWLGDSVGHTEGVTLVVDTTNFNDSGGFYGVAGGMFGWDRNLHVIERFSLFDPDTLLYQFEVDDPTAYTSPWKGELTMARTSLPIYEYACHEGNYAVPNLMKAFHAGQ
jgi:hypothetical protein